MNASNPSMAGLAYGYGPRRPAVWLRRWLLGVCAFRLCCVLCCIVDPSPLIPIPLHGTVSAFDVILDHVPSFFLLTIVIAADSCYIYVLH